MERKQKSVEKRYTVRYFKENDMTVMTKTNKRSVKKSTPLPVEKVMDSIVKEMVTEPTVSLITRSYKELQAMAKDRGLKANGSTADLMARLA